MAHFDDAKAAGPAGHVRGTTPPPPPPPANEHGYSDDSEDDSSDDSSSEDDSSHSDGEGTRGATNSILKRKRARQAGSKKPASAPCWSGFPNATVHWRPKRKCYEARLIVDGERKFVGDYATTDEARAVYPAAIKDFPAFKEAQKQKREQKKDWSGIKGARMRRDKKRKKSYRAYLYVNGELKLVGDYATADEARAVYPAAIKDFPAFKEDQKQKREQENAKAPCRIGFPDATVYWRPKRKCYEAYLIVDGERKFVGDYATTDEARAVYPAAIKDFPAFKEAQKQKREQKKDWSGIKGARMRRDKKRKKSYRAYLYVNGELKLVGCYATEDEARAVYPAAIKDFPAFKEDQKQKREQENAKTTKP